MAATQSHGGLGAKPLGRRYGSGSAISSGCVSRRRHTAPSPPKRRCRTTSPKRRQSIANALLEGQYDMIGAEESEGEAKALGYSSSSRSSDFGDFSSDSDAAAAPAARTASKPASGWASPRSNATSDAGRGPRRSPATAGGGLGISLVVATIVCGCGCQAPYEVMHARDRGCGDLISLAEYLYGIVVSAPGAFRAKRSNGGKWQIGWAFHVGLALSALGYSALMNVALQKPLPMAVLITMKNGNLVANMFVGFCIMGKRYDALQVCAVLLVTGGLVLTTHAGMATASSASGGSAESALEAMWGSVLMASALLVRAVSGSLQEEAFRRTDGPPPVPELLLFRAALGLPYFVWNGTGILSHSRRWWLQAEVGGLPWPSMWLLLLANLVFDYFCKVCMTRLIGERSALTATLVLTFQRFLSFVFSALLLNPPVGGISYGLWAGSSAVILGTLAYAGAPKPKSGALPAGSPPVSETKKSK